MKQESYCIRYTKTSNIYSTRSVSKKIKFNRNISSCGTDGQTKGQLDKLHVSSLDLYTSRKYVKSTKPRSTLPSPNSIVSP
jgi:hypothetical protein